MKLRGRDLWSYLYLVEGLSVGCLLGLIAPHLMG